MHLLIATDAFPPVCGGSGWSTYELVRGLRARGHHVVIVQPRFEPASSGRPVEYDGFRVRHLPAVAPNVPYVRNYFKNERFYARLDLFLRRLISEERVELVHAQHVLTSPPAVSAARAEGVPVVCTVRDYWPVCYWSDLIYDYAADTLCPECSPAMMTRCVRPRARLAWPLALPFIPYMMANLARKQHSLSHADAVVAVSSALARDLRRRAPDLANTRIETIPNPVDITGIRAVADRTTRPLAPAYAVYVGKLAPNKGVSKLFAASDRAQLPWPLVIVGDGPERRALEQAAAHSGRDVRFTGWLPREEAIAWLCHASLLIFPSHGPESLSRVLLEAAVLGVPIAAMDTGGTRDIITDEQTGLLSTSADELGDDVARLAGDEKLRTRLASAARAAVEGVFDVSSVVSRIESLYDDLRQGGRRADPPTDRAPASGSTDGR